MDPTLELPHQPRRFTNVFVPTETVDDNVWPVTAPSTLDGGNVLVNGKLLRELLELQGAAAVHIAVNDDEQLPAETTVNAYYLPCPFASRNTLKVANLIAVFNNAVANFNSMDSWMAFGERSAEGLLYKLPRTHGFSFSPKKNDAYWAQLQTSKFVDMKNFMHTAGANDAGDIYRYPANLEFAEGLHPRPRIPGAG